jgi:hypothetical protein
MLQHHTAVAGAIGAEPKLLRVTPESLNLHFTQFLTPSFASCLRAVGARARRRAAATGRMPPGEPRCEGASMKSRHPNVEWIKKVLADLERDRSDPQIAAIMDRQMGETAPPARAVRPAQELLDSAPLIFKP